MQHHHRLLSKQQIYTEDDRNLLAEGFFLYVLTTSGPSNLNDALPPNYLCIRRFFDVLPHKQMEVGVCISFFLPEGPATNSYFLSWPLYPHRQALIPVRRAAVQYGWFWIKVGENDRKLLIGSKFGSEKFLQFFGFFLQVHFLGAFIWPGFDPWSCSVLARGGSANREGQPTPASFLVGPPLGGH